MKRLITFLLTITIAACLWAGNTITYTADAKLTETTSANNGLRINGFNASISSHTFSNGVGTITFSDEVTLIGPSAFFGCSNMTSVTIPNTVTTIGDYAFYGCNSLYTIYNFSSLILTKGATYYGYVAYHARHIFNGDEVGDFIIQNDTILIGYIGDEADITIPDGVTTISSDAFFGCSGLTSITIPDGVTSIGSDAFRGCSGLTSVTIPDGVTSIGSDAFRGCSGLTSVAIPDGVIRIGNNAFYDCSSLTSVTIPNSVTRIGSDAFYGCSSLTSVAIPNGVTSIASNAFREILTINYTGSATGAPWGARSMNGFIDGYCVYSDSTKTVLLRCSRYAIGECIIPNSVTFVRPSAFRDCPNLTSITIPDGVTTLQDSTFYRCTSLTSVDIPNTVTSIGSAVFSYCSSLSSITFPNSITAIPRDAFEYCSGLTSVTIPDGVTSIGEYAFWCCNGLTSVNIPNSVSVIGEFAFQACSGLASITCLANTPPSISPNTFDAVSKSIPVYVPKAAISEYRTANYWRLFTNFIELDDVIATFLNYDGTTVYIDTVAYASLPVYRGETPVKPATPQYSYIFSGWDKEFEELTEDETYIAQFDSVINQYVLTLSVNDENMGAVAGAGLYNYATSVELTAIPVSGYEFVKWSDGSTYNPYTFIIREDMSLQAEFREIPNALEEVEAASKVQKIFRDGQIFIIRDGKCYTVQGTEMK